MKIKSNSIKKIITYIIILTLTLGSVFLRFFKLGTQSYWMDEGYTVNAVLSVIERGKTILDSGQYYSCPTYCYPTAFFANIFGAQNPASYRALAALAGILFIVVIFFIIKKWFGYKAALLSSFFIAFSYWQIAWSRQARWYTLLELFFWLTIYFFWQTINFKNNYKQLALNLFMTILWTVLAITTHAEAYLLLPVFMGWTIYAFCTNESLHPKKKALIIFSSILFATILALVVDHLGLNFLKTLLSGLHFHYSLPYYLNFYLRNYWLFIPFAIWAITTCNKKSRALIAYLFTIILTYLSAFGFLSDMVHYRYLFLVTPALYILGACGMLSILEHFKHSLRRVVFFVVISIFIISGHGVIWPRASYQLESDDLAKIKGRPYYAYTPQPDFNGAYNYVKTQKGQEDVIISTHPAFNKIYLDEPAYWLKYPYLGIEDKNTYISPDNREYYVGAKVIANLGDLQRITEEKHGFIVFDYYSTQDRIPQAEIEYIKTNFRLVFQKETNSFSKIWVYRF